MVLTADTIRTVEGYADCIVLRHFTAGSAAEAAAVSSKPIISAGDGPGQHPTQVPVPLQPPVPLNVFGRSKLLLCTDWTRAQTGPPNCLPRIQHCAHSHALQASVFLVDFFDTWVLKGVGAEAL